MRAIYVTNGGFDAVVVPDGTYLFVDPEVFRHFLLAQSNGDDFTDWHGINDWTTSEDDIWTAAEGLGDIVAYYDAAGNLVVFNDRLWQERLDFWGA